MVFQHLLPTLCTYPPLHLGGRRLIALHESTTPTSSVFGSLQVGAQHDNSSDFANHHHIEQHVFHIRFGSSTNNNNNWIYELCKTFSKAYFGVLESLFDYQQHALNFSINLIILLVLNTLSTVSHQIIFVGSCVHPLLF